MLEQTQLQSKWRVNNLHVFFFRCHCACALDIRKGYDAITGSYDKLRHTLFFLSGQSNSQFMALSLLFPSMLKLRNSELQQPRRLRQIKRQVKVNICSMIAMLRLLLFARILSLTNYAKIGPVGVN